MTARVLLLLASGASAWVALFFAFLDLFGLGTGPLSLDVLIIATSAALAWTFGLGALVPGAPPVPSANAASADPKPRMKTARPF